MGPRYLFRAANSAANAGNSLSMLFILITIGYRILRMQGQHRIGLHQSSPGLRGELDSCYYLLGSQRGFTLDTATGNFGNQIGEFGLGAEVEEGLDQHALHIAVSIGGAGFEVPILGLLDIDKSMAKEADLPGEGQTVVAADCGAGGSFQGVTPSVD